MISFYQCIFSEIMTSPEPISSYCQWHLAPVSTLWNHQIRSSELICDRHSKGQQHLSSPNSSLSAALPGLQSLLSKALFTQRMIRMAHVCILCVTCSAFREGGNEGCTEVAKQTGLVFTFGMERPVGTRDFRTRGEEIQVVNKKASCKTARAGRKENTKHELQQTTKFSEYGQKRHRQAS